MAFPTFTLISSILVLILIIVATLAVIYYDRRQSCYSYVSPWCYGDWSCANTLSPPYSPVTAFLAVIEACKPVNGQSSPACLCSWENFYDPAGQNTCTTS